jgi:selenocysteine lyase/cysteine desulfurase
LLALLLDGTSNVPGLRDMKHVTAYGIGDDLSRQSLLVGFNLEGITSADGCDLYRGEQLRLHATGHDPFFGLMLKQLGISSFIRLSGSHYNTPREIERFLEATATFAPAQTQVPVGASTQSR